MVYNEKLISQLIQNIGISSIITISSAYVILVSAFYLYSYWNSFELNVFEYLSIGDLITYAMPFFLLLLILFLMILSLSQIGPIPIPARFKNYVASATPLALIIVILWTLCLLWSKQWEQYGILICLILLIIPLVLALIRSEIGPVIQIIMLIPFVAIDLGLSNASKVKQGEATLFVDLSKSVLQLPIDQHRQVSYLGRLRDVFILYETSSDRLIIVSTDKFESLALVTVKKGTKKQSRSWVTGYKTRFS